MMKKSSLSGFTSSWGTGVLHSSFFSFIFVFLALVCIVLASELIQEVLHFQLSLVSAFGMSQQCTLHNNEIVWSF